MSSLRTRDPRLVAVVSDRYVGMPKADSEEELETKDGEIIGATAINFAADSELDFENNVTATAINIKGNTEFKALDVGKTINGIITISDNTILTLKSN